MIKLLRSNPMARVSGFVQELRDQAVDELERATKMEDAATKARLAFADVQLIASNKVIEAKKTAKQADKMASAIEGAYS